MAFPPGRPVPDPLLEPDSGPLDHIGAPIRAPIGNSARTLLLLGLAAVLGVAFWWIRGPSDLSAEIGGHPWGIIEVDGQPAADEAGGLATVILLGAGGLRSGASCGPAVGDWSYEPTTHRLTVDWDAASDAPCDANDTGSSTFATGRIELDGAAMTVETAHHTVRSIAYDMLSVVTVDDLAGRWTMGVSTVEFGRRGLLRVDDCSGSWVATGEGITARFDDDESAGCELDTIWTGGEVLIPVMFEDALYLRRPGGAAAGVARLFRLDPAPDRISPLPDGP